MNRPTQQHFVTRAYLAGFLMPGETQLHVYTRNREKAFRAAPENLAKMRNYYSVEKEDGTFDDTLEHILETNIEHPGLEVIKRLLAGRYGISRDARNRLTALLAVQEYRVPWMREQMETLTTGLLERFAKSVTEAPGLMEEEIVKLGFATDSDASEKADTMREALLSGDVIIKATPEASLQALAHVTDPLIRAYFQMAWEILETSSSPFVTSDCPVHRYYAPVNPERPCTSLFDPRVEVRFPLSSHKMLVMRHDRERYDLIHALKQRRKHREAFNLLKSASEIRRVKISAQAVERINAHTIAMAARHVFSPVANLSIPELFKGESKNMRQVLTDLPGGVVAATTVYSQ